ncbi:MAG: hypothetical protein Q4G12_05475 [Bacteroidales bacterium]|nr:hypothetical protein [Bacteroidales bacterium]
MALLKEDGGLDIERINQLPFEEYMKEMGSLTEAQVNEYLSVLSINESNEPAQAVEVEYTLKDELEQGAVIASDYIKNKVRELRQK